MNKMQLFTIHNIKSIYICIYICAHPAAAAPSSRSRSRSRNKYEPTHPTCSLQRRSDGPENRQHRGRIHASISPEICSNTATRDSNIAVSILELIVPVTATALTENSEGRFPHHSPVPIRCASNPRPTGSPGPPRVSPACAGGPALHMALHMAP